MPTSSILLAVAVAMTFAGSYGNSCDSCKVLLKGWKDAVTSENLMTSYVTREFNLFCESGPQGELNSVWKRVCEDRYADVASIVSFSKGKYVRYLSHEITDLIYASGDDEAKMSTICSAFGASGGDCTSTCSDDIDTAISQTHSLVTAQRQVLWYLIKSLCDGGRKEDMWRAAEAKALDDLRELLKEFTEDMQVEFAGWQSTQLEMTSHQLLAHARKMRLSLTQEETAAAREAMQQAAEAEETKLMGLQAQAAEAERDAKMAAMEREAAREEAAALKAQADAAHIAAAAAARASPAGLDGPTSEKLEKLERRIATSEQKITKESTTKETTKAAIRKLLPKLKKQRDELLKAKPAAAAAAPPAPSAGLRFRGIQQHVL